MQKETSKKEGNVSVQSSDENFTALRMQWKISVVNKKQNYKK